MTIAALPEVVVVDTTRHLLMNSVIFAPAGELAVSHDGHILLVSGFAGTFLYDIATGQQIAQIQGPSGIFFSSAVTTDPIRDRIYWTTLTTGGAHLHACDTSLGSELPTPVSSDRWWFAASASRDGTRLYLTAPGSPPSGPNSGGEVQVVNLATFGILANLAGHVGFPEAQSTLPRVSASISGTPSGSAGSIATPLRAPARRSASAV